MPMREPELTPSRVAMAVLAVTIVLVTGAAVASPRVAIVALAVFALAGAGARVFARASRAFVVRSRTTDVSVLLVFGVVLAYLGLTTPLG